MNWRPRSPRSPAIRGAAPRWDAPDAHWSNTSLPKTSLPARRSRFIGPRCAKRRRSGDPGMAHRGGARRVLSVAAGAMAVHLGPSGRGAELLRTGALYGMVHAAALIAVAAIAQSRGPVGLALTVAGWSFAAGMLL